MSPIVAVLDACTMVPLTLCDTLLRAAERRIYEVRWSDTILDELQRSLAKKLALGDARAQRRINAQREYFPEALVRGFEPLIAHLENHPKDRHVLAAAITGQAASIVTFNLRDFPDAAMVTWGITAEAPDRFLTRLFATAPAIFSAIIDEQASDVRRSREEVLARLARDGAAVFAQQVRDVIRAQQ